MQAFATLERKIYPLMENQRSKKKAVDDPILFSLQYSLVNMQFDSKVLQSFRARQSVPFVLVKGKAVDEMPQRLHLPIFKFIYVL